VGCGLGQRQRGALSTGEHGDSRHAATAKIRAAHIGSAQTLVLLASVSRHGMITVADPLRGGKQSITSR
jgi:hypothetical protein